MRASRVIDAREAHGVPERGGKRVRGAQVQARRVREALVDERRRQRAADAGAARFGVDVDVAHAAVRGVGIERVECLCADGAKLYPLPPPHATAELVFAADAGADNTRLRASLGNPPAFIFDPATGALEDVR